MENTSVKTTEQLLLETQIEINELSKKYLLLEEQQKTNKLLKPSTKENELIKYLEKQKSIKETRLIIGCLGLIIAYILNRIANG